MQQLSPYTYRNPILGDLIERSGLEVSDESLTGVIHMRQCLVDSDNLSLLICGDQWMQAGTRYTFNDAIDDETLETTTKDRNIRESNSSLTILRSKSTSGEDLLTLNISFIARVSKSKVVAFKFSEAMGPLRGSNDSVNPNRPGCVVQRRFQPF